MHATTILAVRRDGQAAMGGDGQVTLGQTIVKGTANKIRCIANGNVLVGFAGASADAFTLMERFEAKLKESRQGLQRAAVALAKDWRTDRYLRRLEAMLIAMDREVSLMVSGSGDVIVPDENVLAVGSGGSYALSAARALSQHTTLSARNIVEHSLSIAADVCVYTNHNLHIEELAP